MKLDAIGVVEVSFYSNAVVILDRMLKASNVELVSCYKKLGGRMVHTVISGKTSSIMAAIEAANQAKELIGEEHLKVAITINNPHPEVVKLMNLIDDKVRKESSYGREYK